MYFLNSACCQRYAESPRAVCVPAAGETVTPQPRVPKGQRGASPVGGGGLADVLRHQPRQAGAVGLSCPFLRSASPDHSSVKVLGTNLPAAECPGGWDRLS